MTIAGDSGSLQRPHGLVGLDHASWRTGATQTLTAAPFSATWSAASTSGSDALRV